MKYTLLIHQNGMYAETIKVEFSCADEALACVSSFPHDESLSFELIMDHQKKEE